jgi:Arc/MetJ-type ribon-helix-helix transcriptional regulator
MFSIRLPRNLEEKLESLAEKEGRTRSELVKEALTEYLAQREETRSAFARGSDLFGRHGSGAGNLSRDYKRLLKVKLHAKMPR